jgi:site-specific recombinase XerD
MQGSPPTRATEQAADAERVADILRKQGHSAGTIYGYVHSFAQLWKWSGASDYTQLSADRVVQWARAFARAHRIKVRTTRRAWLYAFRAFAWGLERLGKTVGSTKLSERANTDRDSVMAAFADYGEKLGWSDRTIRAQLRNIGYLRSYLIKRRAAWPVPRLIDVDHFLQQAAKRWSRVTIVTSAAIIRSWLRFLFVTGRSARDWAPSVSVPPLATHPRPARALPWATVRQLRRGIDTTTPMGKRDYGQYCLFCAYGLGASEINNLKLEDIDWDASILHVRRPKTGIPIDLPLSPVVAKAIADYLRHGRPQTSSRHVFIRHTIPFGPLSTTTVHARLQGWALRAKVKASFLGTHLFRHSFATRQVERGVALKIVGDILGHRRAQSTSIYVRTSLAKLRRVALPVPA